MPEWPREVNGQACGHQPRELVQKFQGSNLKNISVAYYDTPALELQALALTVRLRVKEDVGEITVKWRAETLPTDTASGAECEVDVYRGRALSACSWNLDIDRAKAVALMTGKATSLRELLSKEQKDVIARLAGSLTGPWRRFGPVQVERWDIAAGARGKKWRLERWIVGRDQTLLSEVSFSEKKASDISELRTLLDDHFRSAGIKRCEQDEPKTSTVLRYFSEGAPE